MDILSDPQNNKHEMKKRDVSRRNAAIGLDNSITPQQLALQKLFSEPELLPEGAQLIGTCLIVKKERTADGQIEHYKPG